jgi:hypothetical protein
MLTSNYFNERLGWGDQGTVQLPFEKRSLISARDDAPAPLYPIDEADGDDEHDDIMDTNILPAIGDDVPPNCKSEAGCEYLGDKTE